MERGDWSDMLDMERGLLELQLHASRGYYYVLIEREYKQKRENMRFWICPVLCYVCHSIYIVHQLLLDSLATMKDTCGHGANLICQLSRTRKRSRLHKIVNNQ